MSNQTIENPVIPSLDCSVSTAPVAATVAEPKAHRRKPLPGTGPWQSAQPHCRHRVRLGRYCRLPVLDASTGLCFRHAALRQNEVDGGDFSAELVCGIDEFRSAEDINHVLGELYKLLASNKISPRRGAVMAYTCSLLLRTLPVIDRELQADDSEPQIIFDLPRPKRDSPEDPERALYKRMSSQSVPNNGDTPNGTNTLSTTNIREPS